MSISNNEMVPCLECRVAPVLLVLKVTKRFGTQNTEDEMYCYGCDQCKYFCSESHSISGAKVEWHRTNCLGQPESNLALRRERMLKIRSGELTITVKEKLPSY